MDESLNLRKIYNSRKKQKHPETFPIQRNSIIIEYFITEDSIWSYGISDSTSIVMSTPYQLLEKDILETAQKLPREKKYTYIVDSHT